MASTENLLGLIDEFSEAFADPDLLIALPPKPAIAEPTKVTDSTVQPYYLIDSFGEAFNNLNSIKEDTQLLKIAGDFLSQLSRLYELKQGSNVALDESKAIAQPVLQLDETYAREGSLDCPSGMCPLDH
jgi:hypothetical protein